QGRQCADRAEHAVAAGALHIEAAAGGGADERSRAPGPGPQEPPSATPSGSGAADRVHRRRCRPRGGAAGAASLQRAAVAGDRRDPPFDRGDRGGDHAPAGAAAGRDRVSLSPGEPLVLASGSATRARLLADAGLPLLVDPAAVDEEEIRASFLAEGRDVNACAAALAEAKAMRVSARHSGVLVLGADQILECEGRWLEKPRDLD